VRDLIKRMNEEVETLNRLDCSYRRPNINILAAIMCFFKEPVKTIFLNVFYEFI